MNHMDYDKFANHLFLYGKSEKEKNKYFRRFRTEELAGLRHEDFTTKKAKEFLILSFAGRVCRRKDYHQFARVLFEISKEDNSMLIAGYFGIPSVETRKQAVNEMKKFLEKMKTTGEE